MTTVAVASGVDPQAIANRLLEARARTFLLLQPLSDQDLRIQHDPLMSPILWDLGHIAHFEELWLTRNLEGPVEFVEMPGLFNPFEHPRSERGALRLPDMDECREIMEEIRAGSWPAWRRRSGIVRIRCSDMVTCTRWCCSTSTSTMRPSSRPSSSNKAVPIRRSAGSIYRGGGLHLPWSHFRHGAVSRWLRGHRHSTTARLPTTMSGPGTPSSWPHSGSIAIRSPTRSSRHSSRPAAIPPGRTGPRADGNGSTDRASRLRCTGARQDGEWFSRTMDRSGPVPPTHPVCHVCYYEAEAFARFAGKRLAHGI